MIGFISNTGLGGAIPAILPSVAFDPMDVAAIDRLADTIEGGDDCLITDDHLDPVDRWLI